MFVVQKPESLNKTIRMPKHMIEELESIASSEGISFNQLIVQCCQYALNNFKSGESNTIASSQK